MSRPSQLRSTIDSATSSAKGQRPAEDAGVAGVRAATRDPFAEASSLLVHLVINRVPPIKHVLDKVTLDEGAAMALAQQWSDEFPAALREQRDALVSTRESISQNWEGEGASKTYQDRQRELEDLADSLAAACEGAGFLTSAVNELMVGVREQIIEWIAQLVSMLMRRLISVVATFWIPIVGEINEAAFIFEGVARVVETIERITSLITRVEGILGEVSSVAQVLGGSTQQVQQLGSALGEVPQGLGASPLRALGRVGSVRQSGLTGSHGAVIRSVVPRRSKSPGGSAHAQSAGTSTRGLGSQTGATPSASSGTHPQGGAVNASTRSLSPDSGTRGPVTRSQTAAERAQSSNANAQAEQARLDARARDLHSRLVNARTGEPDTRAQNSRTSVAMSTREGRDVLAGGGRDLNPSQRQAAGPNDVVATQPGAHAEVTAINGARAAGLTPSQIAVSRPICDNCQDAIQQSGGTVHPDRMGATWP
ncbi:hypothetical protein Srot_1811 [Segniliparus rotundus DSM 44985]|uniref:Uncharacterized protein n=1 Tax=Segniliparus rotundus (strain ATCC BAA-972 / CDC 1076 / CIP 108378 / DSM 44985 / JCM 13578) TaxID=640132 RepID=D6Z8J1_SEGRD|nr:hypothetical protein [Segniliparus rotundus]ADG98271.1 hypothetical protein Srot_1811 [Segniliparus rotundus DSM 44985]